MNIPVLIAGAGPTGLTLALRLARHGVPFRIIDRNSGPGLASRAMAVQSRTLEFYAQLGLADAVIAEGIQMKNAHVLENHREVAQLSWTDSGAGLTPYPFVLCYPQDDHERFLVKHLDAAGVKIEWNVEMGEFKEEGDHVRAVLHRNGSQEECLVSYLCGCDGAHDTIRQQVGIDFPGGTYEQLFYVADVSVPGVDQTNMFMALGKQALVLMMPVRSSGMERLIGVVPTELRDRAAPTFEDIRPSAEAMLGIKVGQVNWFSTYRVHHRVASHFRVGRVFLAGDAGHLHSPAGGQGMNTGIGDAVNLSWKLAQVVQGRISPNILDTYEAERIPFARKLVATTDRAFEGIEGEGWGSDFLRTWALPHLVPALGGIPALRRAMFETISQIRINYRDSALSEGQAGEVHGGDRLPWRGDNYQSLTALDWRIHIYGETAKPFAEAAETRGLAVDEFAWNDKATQIGLKRDAAYLVRPDGHVALALPDQEEKFLHAYADRVGLSPCMVAV